MIAKDLMTEGLVVVPPDMPVAAIAELLAARGISAVPVVDTSGAPLGVVTEGDLIRRLAEQPRGPFRWFLDLFRDPAPMAQRFAKAHGKTARDVMSKDLVTVGEASSAEEIARLMEQHGIRRVPGGEGREDGRARFPCRSASRPAAGPERSAVSRAGLAAGRPRDPARGDGSDA